MYFSYVPSIIFSFFNRPFFLNLLFKQILIQYYLIQYYSIVSLGTRLAAATAGCLRIVDAASGTVLSEKQSVPSDIHVASLAWSPSGTEFAIFKFIQTGFEDFHAYLDIIPNADAANGEVSFRQVTSHSLMDIRSFSMSWNSAGTKLAFLLGAESDDGLDDMLHIVRASTRVERFDRRGTEPFEPFRTIRTIRILSK